MPYIICINIYFFIDPFISFFVAMPLFRMTRKQFLHCLYTFGISSIARSCFKYFIQSGFLQHPVGSGAWRRLHALHCSCVKMGSIRGKKRKMLFRFWMLCLVLFYYWYFYHVDAEPLPKPSAPKAPDKPEPWSLEFEVASSTEFRFLYNKNVALWQHVFADAVLYWVQKTTGKIIERDECHLNEHTHNIAAKGASLYQYVQQHPQFHDLVHHFKADNPYPVPHGNAFFFHCVNRQIDHLGLCESGKVFQNEVCVDVASCTGLPDLTFLPFPGDPTQYIECVNGREFFKKCPSKTYFYRDHCIQNRDAGYCQFHGTTAPTKLNPTTVFQCRDYQPVYTYCPPGTRVFDKPECETAVCFGQPNGTKLPLEKRQVGPFQFSPGYIECRNDRIWNTVECSKVWDPARTAGHDLTGLPMVFHEGQCAPPAFCENVTSVEPDTIVPLHAFTQHVANWPLSASYDASAGYVCLNGKRQLKDDLGRRRIKRFKEEDACDSPHARLGIFGKPESFYDCSRDHVATCPAGDYFDGEMCRPRPTKPVFEFEGLPLFQFDPLNVEGWISSWDKTTAPSAAPCRYAFEYLEVYNICSHRDCKPYAFLSMIPDMTMLLPFHEQAKCVFNESDRHLKKVKVDRGYTYWDQKLWPDRVHRQGTCVVSQNIRTGHYVFDKTIFVTCDPRQPFVFCPSLLTQKIIQVKDGLCACESPQPSSDPDDHDWKANSFRYDTTNVDEPGTWATFSYNEVKRIAQPVKDGLPYRVYFNKAEKKAGIDHEVPEEGLEVPPDSRFKYQGNRPVNLELHYRVTHPPNVAFQYDDSATPGQYVRRITSGEEGHGFYVHDKAFTKKSLQFPRYRVIPYVSGGLLEKYEP